MQVKVIAKVEMCMFISVLFANGRWPRSEDVSVKKSEQSCGDMQLYYAAWQ